MDPLLELRNLEASEVKSIWVSAPEEELPILSSPLFLYSLFPASLFPSSLFPSSLFPSSYSRLARQTARSAIRITFLEHS